LLNHTSGLFNYTEGLDLSPEGWLAQRYRSWQPEELVALAVSHPPLFAPGTDWSYSNTNYVLLGMVIEAVTGRGYATEIRNRIIRPLHLRQTESPGTRLDIAGPHAHGYLPVDGSPVDVTRLNPSIAGAAGDLISSTADLNTFFKALLTGRLLRPAQLAEMQTTVAGHGYGLGLERETLPCGTEVFGHGGDIFGYATISLHTAAGRRQLTASVNPYTGELGEPANALLSHAFCPAS
jgi:D-alanyl-D-alanine carboxypeptidase